MRLLAGAAGSGETPYPVAARAGLRCLQRMVRPAQALAVGWVERVAAVLPFFDMVGEEPVVRRGLSAPPAVVDCLAAVARALQD